jgi:hypothetical protein
MDILQYIMRFSPTFSWDRSVREWLESKVASFSPVAGCCKLSDGSLMLPKNSDLNNRLRHRAESSKKYTIQEFKQIMFDYVRSRNRYNPETDSFERIDLIKRLNIADGPIRVFSDIHGKLPELLNFLEHSKEFIQKGGRIIFNGDIADRGHWSIECLALVMQLATSNPQQFMIGRGNHEFLGFALRLDEEHSQNPENSVFENALLYFLDDPDLPDNLKGLLPSNRESDSQNRAKYEDYKAYIRKLFYNPPEGVSEWDAPFDQRYIDRRIRAGSDASIESIDLNYAFACMPFGFSIEDKGQITGFVVHAMLPAKLIVALK